MKQTTKNVKKEKFKKDCVFVQVKIESKIDFFMCEKKMVLLFSTHSK